MAKQKNYISRSLDVGFDNLLTWLSALNNPKLESIKEKY